MCKQAIVRQIEPTPSKIDLINEYLHNSLTSFQMDPACGPFQRGFEAAIQQVKEYADSL